MVNKKNRVIRGMSKDVQLTVKENIPCSIGKLVQKLESFKEPFMKHVGRVKHQFHATRLQKENLQEQEILIYIDFSENYTAKYSEEMLSMHFGAPKNQFTLHTGFIYRHQGKPIGFCAITDNLQHDPPAI
ncbi:unnamed protein product [Psylliodes chrysocephalus]|uniref:Uncharacterized protein n=1 Tax=Psylliodes chrysocephalus TaxID=3402493 RepID=A0A9P0G8J0_9CUCU|nr:unnamed protein product [Psylliodes chrysocephala]